MNIQTPSNIQEKIVITELTHEFAVNLRRHSYFTSSNVLNLDLRNRLCQIIKMLPRATKLVAYETEKKCSIGFLCLEENTDWLYSIKYVFVDPKYRKMGVATRLLNYAMTLAKAKGAKKVNLNVYKGSMAIELYRRLGFTVIGHTLLGQGYLLQGAPFRVMRRIIVGQGFLTKLAEGKKGCLFELSTSSRRNREMLFCIYERCMSKKWTNFFEIDSDNLMNGARHVWRPPFFKDALVNKSADSFVLIFNRPLSYKATVELYLTSDVEIQSVLEDVLRILVKRGVSLAQITLFNSSEKIALSWFQEKEMKTFQFVAMGKTI
jgi:predicted GNAT family N-acyltransferase